MFLDSKNSQPRPQLRASGVMNTNQLKLPETQPFSLQKSQYQMNLDHILNQRRDTSVSFGPNAAVRPQPSHILFNPPNQFQAQKSIGHSNLEQIMAANFLD